MRQREPRVMSAITVNVLQQGRVNEVLEVISCVKVDF